MKITFKDGTTKEFPFDAWKAAKLVHIAMKHGGNIGYKVELDESRSFAERQKQAKQIEKYVHWLEMKDR